MSSHIQIENLVVNVQEIVWVDLEKFERFLEVTVLLRNHGRRVLHRAQAVDFVYRICPQVLEGRRLKWIKHRWMIHNLVGHPLMQAAAFIGHYDLAMKIHDFTIPKPRSL